MAIAIIVISVIFLAPEKEIISMEVEKANIKHNFDYVPHKALYQVQLVSKKTASDINNIHGKIFFEWKNGCDGWITSHQFNLIYDLIDTESMNIISDFSNFESYDSKNMNFSARIIENGTIVEDIRGSSNKLGNGEVKAILSKPSELELKLDKNTLYPNEHTIQILEEIKKGTKFFNSSVFDGSDRKGSVNVNSFIGKQVNALANIKTSPDIDTFLINNNAWKVRMAFFTNDEPENEYSDYEMNVTLHENGVISDAFIEYNDFTIEQKLIALERLEDKKCKN